MHHQVTFEKERVGLGNFTFVCGGEKMLLKQHDVPDYNGGRREEYEFLYLLEGTGKDAGTLVVLHHKSDAAGISEKLMRGVLPDDWEIVCLHIFKGGVLPRIFFVGEPWSHSDGTDWDASVQARVGVNLPGQFGGFAIKEVLAVPDIGNNVHACRALVKAWQNRAWKESGRVGTNTSDRW